MYLTEKQKRIYRFVKEYIDKHDIAPSYEEIKSHFGFRSISTVFDHVRTLEKKGVISREGFNTKRSIQITDFGTRSTSIPLVGTVAAGRPIEVYEIQDSVDVADEMAGSGQNVALTIRGNSMTESGIYDGDIVIVKRQNSAENGQIVIALVDGEATIKRIYFHKDKIELRPSNPSMQPLFVTEKQDFQIYGILVGLYRKFNL